MPHYYFHLRHGSHLIIIDDEGQDLRDENAARAEAAKSVREMLGEAIRSNHDVPEAMVVVDEDGREVASVPFADAVPAELKAR